MSTALFLKDGTSGRMRTDGTKYDHIPDELVCPLEIVGSLLLPINYRLRTVILGTTTPDSPSYHGHLSSETALLVAYS